MAKRTNSHALSVEIVGRNARARLESLRGREAPVVISLPVGDVGAVIADHGVVKSRVPCALALDCLVLKYPAEISA